MDLSHFRPDNQFSKITAMMTQEPDRTRLYVNKVYKILLDLKPGDELSVLDRVPEDSREMFIHVACMAITEKMNLEFNESFTVIRCLEPVLSLKPIKKDDDEEGKEDNDRG